MSAFNDRRSGSERREGDRRWLGKLKEVVKEDNQLKSDEHRDFERRIGEDRREKNNPLSHIEF